MDDDKIIELYWQRDEKAVCETELKFGKYLLRTAMNILGDQEDSKESVNETYLSAWKTIPPHKPVHLSAYLAKLTRRISISMLRKRTSRKRMPEEYMLSLSELEDCIPAGNTPEQEADTKMLGESLNHFLKKIPETERNLFVLRYFFSYSVRESAKKLEMSESKAKSMLYRTRSKLKRQLEQEGYL